MELTHEDVLAILEILERSNVEYLEVEVGATRLVADRSGGGATRREYALHEPGATGVAAPAVTTAVTPAPAPVQVAVPVPVPETAPSVTAAPPAVAKAEPDTELVTVTAPVVGVFYRAPEPGAPPFVEVGSHVDEGTTIGLVEVMKMFNSVTAPVHGEVVELLVENEDFVEFGQPLIVLRPKATG
jgi:acetyl-CoA carboxylase biotin carboxyl carrier protein